MADKFYSRTIHIIWLARHHWRARRTYRNSSDWLFSIYSSIVLLIARYPWPGRGVVRTVYSPFVEGPTYLRVGYSDWLMFEELFCGGEYEPLLKNKPPEIDVILDLGANIGLSLKLWQKAFPNSRIIAVEPDPANLMMASRNAGPSVLFIQAGAGSTAGKLFLNQNGPSCEYKVSTSTEQSTDITVNILTVPLILKAAGVHGQVDLLKCDIEGSEAELFTNCSAWIKRVKHLVVEIHPPYNVETFLNDIQRSGSDLTEYNRIEKGESLQVLFLTRLG